MIIKATGTGKTLKDANNAALKALNAPKSVTNIKFEVIETAKPKLFGLFGGSPFIVEASYEAPDEVAEKGAPKKVKEEKQSKKGQKEQKTEKTEKTKKNKKTPATPAKVSSATAPKTNSNEDFAKAKTYIRTILAGLGIDECEVEINTEDNDIRININCGDDYGCVIGRRGETLDAIQYLTRLVINREYDNYKHISINVGNYREKREATLQSLAKKNASRVRKYGRNVVLEPMNPYERCIIHTTVQEIDGVTSHSVGSDDDRKVVITLEEGVKPLNGGGGGNRGRGGNNRGRAPRQNYEVKPTREPRSDSAGSLYGKIEVPKD